MLRMLEGVLGLPALLTDALRQLRAAAGALDASCVADERSLSLALRPVIGAQLEEMVIGAGGTAHMAKDGGGLYVHFQRASSPPRR